MILVAKGRSILDQHGIGAYKLPIGSTGSPKPSVRRHRSVLQQGPNKRQTAARTRCWDKAKQLADQYKKPCHLSSDYLNLPCCSKLRKRTRGPCKSLAAYVHGCCSISCNFISQCSNSGASAACSIVFSTGARLRRTIMSSTCKDRCADVAWRASPCLQKRCLYR